MRPSRLLQALAIMLAAALLLAVGPPSLDPQGGGARASAAPVGLAAARAEAATARAIPVEDILLVSGRLNAEAPGCGSVGSQVQEVLSTPVGQRWDSDNPIEWERIAWLVRAYGCDQGSSQVRDRLVEALDFAEANTPIDDCSWEVFNCWHIDQGINRVLGPAMLFGGDSLPGDLKPRVDDLYRRFYSKARRSENGADAMWAAFANLYGALYFSDQERLETVRDLAHRSTTAEGYGGQIMQDWSYFYHWDKLGGSYASSNARDTARYMRLTHDTALDLDPEAKAGFFAWFQHWHQWTLYKGHNDPLTKVSKFPYYDLGHQVVSGAEDLLALEDPEGVEYAQALERIVGGSNQPLGAISYPLDSYLVARRPGFFASLKLISLADPHWDGGSSFNPHLGAVNVLTPDTVGQKLRGNWGEADAELLLHPHQVLGLVTTNAGQGEQLYSNGEGHFYGPAPPLNRWGWYGVTTLAGTHGMAAQAFDWDLAGGNLQLEKSWFLFDDEILAAQTGATDDPGGAQTWLLSFKVQDPSLLTGSGTRTLPLDEGEQLDLGQATWAHTNGFGYAFLAGEQVRVEAVEEGYARVSADHGAAFASAVALLPGASPAFTAAYTSSGVELLQLDREAHVLRDRSSGVLGAAVFQPLERPEIGLNRPGYVLYSAGDPLSLSLFNPHLETRLGLEHPDLGEGFNPKYDVMVQNPTVTTYSLTVPFALETGADCTGCDLFELAYDGNNHRTTLTIPLRVNRKFELRARPAGIGYVIEAAAVGLNDPTDGLPSAQVPACADGRDNDGDGRVDYPEDPGCASPGDHSEVDEPVFADVALDHWAHAEIEALYRAGYVAGCSAEPRLYCPEATMTRAESAVFVVRGAHGAGFEPPRPGTSPFEDMALEDWFVEWVTQLWEEGYTAGCWPAPLRYCPLLGHTRAEAAVFFTRMVQGPGYEPGAGGELPYADVPAEAWYQKWVAAAYAEGIVGGCEPPGERGDELYRPEAGLTRAEAACMMARAKGLDQGG